MMNERRHSLISNQSPWKDNNNSIWLGSTVVLNRNLEKFKFPGKLPADKRKQIISLVGKDLLTSSALINPRLLKAEEMPPIEKEFLVEHFLSPQSFQQAQAGEAFVIDDGGAFLGVINLGDHLSLQWIDCQGELEETWKRLVDLENQLSKSVNFAFSSRFGFLTSDPTQCGTGLIIRVFLHLPALIYSETLEGVIKKYKEEGILQTGLQGDSNDTIGDVVAFQNAYTLGVTEENILSSLRTLTIKVLVEEKSARSHINQEGPSSMKDKVSRAYAILMHSYQIEAIEALNSISLLKLGVDLGWVTGITHTALNELFLNSRRAHLLYQHDAKINQEEILHRRAEFIHQALNGVTLHI